MLEGRRLWAAWSFATLLLAAACTTAPVVAPEAAQARQGWYAERSDGHVRMSERADERFLPASVQKLFVTAAAFHYLGDLETPEAALETQAGLRARGDGLPPDLVLSGGGDPSLGAGPGCVETCLEMLADAIVSAGVTEITDVAGDATRLPDEPYARGWSWDDLQWYYGAPVSALTVNGNALTLSIAPGFAPGDAANVAWAPGDALLELDNRLVTSAPGVAATLAINRSPGQMTVTVSGTIPQDAPARSYRLAVADPALGAATRFVDLLRARGVTVHGGVRSETRRASDLPVQDLDIVARLAPQPLVEAVRAINEDSDNLGAELLLRRVASAAGGEGGDDGLNAIAAMLAEAGIREGDIDLYDASGLSTLNRVTPRALVVFLRWTMQQPWGETWRGTLPVAAESGTLQRRFVGTPLAGRLVAKTGTLTGVNALAGFLPGGDGRVIIFAVLSNERPSAAPSVLPGIDRTLVSLARQK